MIIFRLTLLVSMVFAVTSCGDLPDNPLGGGGEGDTPAAGITALAGSWNGVHLVSGGSTKPASFQLSDTFLHASFTRPNESTASFKGPYETFLDEKMILTVEESNEPSFALVSQKLVMDYKISAANEMSLKIGEHEFLLKKDGDPTAPTTDRNGLIGSWNCTGSNGNSWSFTINTEDFWGTMNGATLFYVKGNTKLVGSSAEPTEAVLTISESTSSKYRGEKLRSILLAPKSMNIVVKAVEAGQNPVTLSCSY